MGQVPLLCRKIYFYPDLPFNKKWKGGRGDKQ